MVLSGELFAFLIGAPVERSQKASVTRDPRRKAILTLAASLAAAIAEVDLNQIDGEFYWRICRESILGPLTRSAAEIAPHILESEVPLDTFDEWNRRFEAGEITVQDQDARFRHKVRIRQLASENGNLVEQIPRYVWEHFATGRRLPLLETLVLRHVKNGRALEVQVHSQSVTGDQVAAFVDPPLGYQKHMIAPWVLPPHDLSEEVGDQRDLADGGASRLVGDAYKPRLVTTPAESGSESAFVHILFAVKHPRRGWRRTPGSHVSVTLYRPLPSKNSIAFEYDEVVRMQKQWHLQLPGGGSPQEKHVAIRTWATGLLVASGVDVEKARLDVASAMGLEPVRHPRFVEDRKTLLSRAPQARKYLYRRTPRSKS